MPCWCQYVCSVIQGVVTIAINEPQIAPDSVWLLVRRWFNICCWQEGTAFATDVIKAWKVFSIDHRRSGHCSAEPRGNGSTLQVDSGPLREDEYLIEFEPTIFEVGEFLQGPDDDSSSDRSFGASQYQLGTERSELSLRAG